MSKYLFSGLIRYEKCNKNYKDKMYRNKKIYVCSGKANYGIKFCTTNGRVDEDDLLFLVGEDNIQKIKCILVDYDSNVKVVMNDGSELFWDKSKIIR